jgi:hypothetical protein
LNTPNPAKVDQNKKKIEIFTLYPGYDEMVKIAISRWKMDPDPHYFWKLYPDSHYF